MATTISGDNGLVAPVGAVYNGLQSQTAKTATGTSVDFTDIPSWVKRITVIFNGVSTNSTGNYLVRIGSGSLTTTGYASTGSSFNSSGGTAGFSSTSGFGIYVTGASASISGQMVITNVSGNIWVASHSLSKGDANNSVSVGGGTVTLSGALDRVGLTTTTSDTFDAGSINILYE